IDLTVAVQIGVILSAFIFLKRMTDRTTITACRILVKENNPEEPECDDEQLLRTDIPSDVTVFEIQGPFFYSVADLLDEALMRLGTVPRVFILRLNKTSLIDGTGVHAI